MLDIARLISMKKNKNDHKGGISIAKTAEGYDTNARLMPPLTTCPTSSVPA